MSCFKPLQLSIKKPFSTFFSFWNAGKNAQSSTSATSQPASQTEGIYTISHIPFGAMCRDSMSTQVWCHVLSHYSYRWRNLFLPFFAFEMQVKTPSRPRQRHLSQLHKRKVFTPYHIFLLEPCVGTVCPHKFGVMFWAITVIDEETFFYLFLLLKCR